MGAIVFLIVLGVLLYFIFKARNNYHAKRDAKHIARVEKELKKIRDKDNK